MPEKMSRRPPPGFILLAVVALFLWFIVATRDRVTPLRNVQPQWPTEKLDAPHLPPASQHGEAIMGKLANETLKAELGRAAWKLFHTTMARFPDEPTADESDALKSYIYLFARLYPCGECAQHFQQILKKYPPQTSSRNTAAAWACFVHNEVNVSKGKPIFDCNNIGDFYDCGCGEDENDVKSKTGGSDSTRAEHSAHQDPVEIEREGPTRGG